MELIPIQDDLLINPLQITSIERRESRGKVSVRVSMVDGKVYDVAVAPQAFITACNRAGVDLGKQFFSV